MSNPPKILEETTLTSHSVYRGRLLDVWRDEVRLAHGHRTVREYILHPGAVVMVPLLGEGRLVMVRQFRYPLRQVLVELPAGKIDAGENPESTGRRELVEETGYNPQKLTYLGKMHPCIGYSDEQILAYLAEDLSREENQGEHEESLEAFELDFAEALAWIGEGKITDVKTIIGLYWAERFLAGR
ncbi:NUDIX domain-containing protein [Candidatus Neomarinimicrobiota bacterium]